MKILNLEQFLQSPDGTLFAKANSTDDKLPYTIEPEIMIFGGAASSNTFSYAELLNVNTDNIPLGGACCEDIESVLTTAFKEKTSFDLDQEKYERDGLFAPHQLFAVFEQKDIDQLIELILPFSSKEEKIQMGLEEAREVWEYRSNGGVRRASVTTSVNATTGVPIWNTGKGGRLWFDGELCMDELEALLVIGRHEMKQAPVTPEETEVVLSVFEHNGNLVERVHVEGKGHFIRKTDASGEVVIEELPNNRDASADCFEMAVHATTNPPILAKLITSFGPPDDLISIRQHHDGELIVVHELRNSGWHIGFRTNDMAAAKKEFHRLVLENMALGTNAPFHNPVINTN